MASSSAQGLSLDFADIALGYDRSRRAEPAIVMALSAALRHQHARRVLEIGAGTGNYLCALAERGFRTIGLERSASMLERGRAKARAHWIRADALVLPLRDRSVDSAVAVNVVHHLVDVEATFRELRRVVERGVVVQAVVRENLESLWYRHYFPEIDSVLLPLHLPLGRVIITLLRAGFERVTSTPIFYSGSHDLTFESARRQPALLFEQSFREATSGFRRLSRSGIEAGLRALKRDMKSGELARIVAPYDADHSTIGDCVILCGA